MFVAPRRDAMIDFWEKRMKRLAILLTTVFIVSCATNPNKITSAYVSPMQFSNYDCDQIALEQANVERRVAQLYNTLAAEAKGDRWQMGVGMVLFWPTLFALEGGDSPAAGEYALMKGQYQALQTASVQKKCGIAFANDLAETVKTD